MTHVEGISCPIAAEGMSVACARSLVLKLDAVQKEPEVKLFAMTKRSLSLSFKALLSLLWHNHSSSEPDQRSGRDHRT